MSRSPVKRAAVLFLAAAFLWILLAGACASPAPTPTPVIATSLPPAILRTPPPTWTLTFTPPPPSPTFTPSPTSTPSPVPTLSAKAVCAQFWATSNLESRMQPLRIFPGDHTITLLVHSVETDSVVEFLTVHRLTGENRGVALPGGETNVLQLPVSNLPHPGLYDWTLKISSQLYGDICEQGGSFIATSRESTRAEESRLR